MWPYLSRKELVIISPKFPHGRKHLKTREEHIIPFRTSRSSQPSSQRTVSAIITASPWRQTTSCSSRTHSSWMCGRCSPWRSEEDRSMNAWNGTEGNPRASMSLSEWLERWLHSSKPRTSSPSITWTHTRAKVTSSWMFVAIQTHASCISTIFIICAHVVNTRWAKGSLTPPSADIAFPSAHRSQEGPGRHFHDSQTVAIIKSFTMEWNSPRSTTASQMENRTVSCMELVHTNMETSLINWSRLTSWEKRRRPGITPTVTPLNRCLLQLRVLKQKTKVLLSHLLLVSEERSLSFSFWTAALFARSHEPLCSVQWRILCTVCSDPDPLLC